MSDHRFILALIFSLVLNALTISALVLSTRGRRAEIPAKIIISLEEKAAMTPTVKGDNRQSPTARPNFIAEKIRPSAPSPVESVNNGDEIEQRKNAVENIEIVSPPPMSSYSGSQITTVSAVKESGQTTIPAEKNDAEGVFIGDKNVKEIYTAPERLSGAEPRYPQKARRHGWEGRVLMTLTINAAGEVEKVGLTETSGYDILDRSALEAVGGWRFKPARRHGQSITETVLLPFIFQLKSPPSFSQRATPLDLILSSPENAAEKN